jgi:hypothetical protein
MNLYLLISLIAGNLFLCTVILFNLFHCQKLSQSSSLAKVKIESKKIEKPQKLNRLKNIPEKSSKDLLKKSNKLANKDKDKDKDKTIISKVKPKDKDKDKTIISKVKPKDKDKDKDKTIISKVKPKEIQKLKTKPRELKIKLKPEPKTESGKLEIKTENINETNLKGQISLTISNTHEKTFNANIESTKAIEDLTNQYYKSLSLSKKETKALLNTLLKPNKRHPCLAWQINGETLENCQSDSTILEAGIYAINAKLIPCKKQITYKNYKTYIACYKDRKVVDK